MHLYHYRAQSMATDSARLLGGVDIHVHINGCLWVYDYEHLASHSALSPSRGHHLHQLRRDLYHNYSHMAQLSGRAPAVLCGAVLVALLYHSRG